MRRSLILLLFTVSAAVVMVSCGKRQTEGLITSDRNSVDTVEVNDTVIVCDTVVVSITDSLRLNVKKLDYGFLDSIKHAYVVNASKDFFKWSTATDQAWIITDPASGAVAPGESVKVEISVSRYGLSDGYYTGPIFFTAIGKVCTLLVTMSVYQDPIYQFAFRVKDAEFSSQLNRIVMADSQSNRVVILDPETETAEAVNLVLAPTCISVSPDGMHAAVGHNGYFSYLDLSICAVESVYSAGCEVLDIVLAGNGYVYAFPRRDQWTNIFCINLNGGTITRQTGNYIYAGTLGRLHPSGECMYGANNGLSPSDIEKYSITGGTAAYLYDSPYHGTYSMGGNLWFSEDGQRIFVRAGNVFTSSSVKANDMIYTGSLSGIINICSINHLTHSAANGKVFVAPLSYWWYGDIADTLLQIYDDDYLNLETKVGLPKIVVSDSIYTSHIRYVFVKSDGTRYYGLVSAGSVTDTWNQWGLAVFSYPGNKARAKR